MESANDEFKVIVSDRASQMLVEHVHFMAQVSIEAANRLREEILIAMKSLENFPERNAWFLDVMLPANKYKKMIIEKRYLLIYQIKDGMVLVEYVLDCRQEYKWLI